MSSTVSFERFAGLCGLFRAICAVVYTITFITIVGGGEDTEASGTT